MTRFRLSRTPLAALLVLALPAVAAWAQAGTGNGLYGEYYNSGNWTGVVVETRLNEGPIAFFYPAAAAGPPSFDDQLGGTNGQGGPQGTFFGPPNRIDNFSTIWQGRLEAPATGNFRFQVQSDDLARLYINGVQILAPNVTTHTSGAYAMTAGTFYNIVLMHQEYGGGAYIHLRWERPDVLPLIFEPIPKNWFYSPTAVSTVEIPVPSPNGGVVPVGGTLVTLTTTTPNTAIYYTLDGSDPGIFYPPTNPGAFLYTVPFTIDQYGIVRARAYATSGTAQGLVSGLMVSNVFSKVFPNITPPVSTIPGVYFRYYFLPGLSVLPVFDNLAPELTGIMPNFSLTIPVSAGGALPRGDQFGMVHTGYINIPTTGGWRFYTRSDDGSRLYIDGQEVVNNDGLHPTNGFPGVVGGPIQLTAGYHRIEVRMFENGGGESIFVNFDGPGFATTGPIPDNMLFTDPIVATPLISPNGGNFSGSQVVTLTCSTPGALIYWTTDGSAPNPFNPIIHEGTGPSGVQFTITRDTRLRVIAAAPGYTNSIPAMAVFRRSPLLLSATATSVTNTEVLVTFDKAVDPTTALTASNYGLDGGVTINSVSLVGKPASVKRAYWKLDADTTAAEPDSWGSNTALPLPGGVGSSFNPSSQAGSKAPIAETNVASRNFLFVDDAFTVPDSPSLNFGMSSFTVSFWMRPLQSSKALRIINKYDAAAGKGWVLDMNNPGVNMLRFYLDDGPTGVDARFAAGIIPGQWQHVAVRVDRLTNRISIFRDGTLYGTTDMAANFGNADNASPLLMGRLEYPVPLNNPDPYKGNLDEIRLYGTGLTDGEILGLANGGVLDSQELTTMVRLSTSTLGASHTLTVSGVRAIGALTLPCPSQTAAFTVVGTGTILQETFTSIGGSSMTDLTRNPAFPTSSTSAPARTLFGIPPGVAENYGSRLRGYFVVPAAPAGTNNWKFAIATDDYGQFWLSPNEDPANKQLVSRVVGWTGFQTYVNGTVTQSAQIPLVAGQKYYVEALMKEGGGGDNLDVAAKVNDATAIANAAAPIAGLQLVPMRDPIVILRQPYGKVTGLGTSIQFDIQVTGTGPLTYLWRKNTIALVNGGAISGATSSLLTINPTAGADNGLYDVVITNSATGQVVTSDQARLLVYTAAGPPTFTSFNPTQGSAGGGVSNQVTIVGTNFMDGATSVAFGPNPGTIVSVTPTQILVNPPPGVVGPVTVLVATPLGYVSSALLIPNVYTYLVAPTVTAVVPPAGLQAGGYNVTLTGTAFVMGTTTVTFGGLPGTVVSVTGGTSMLVTVPAGAVIGPVDVVVTNPGNLNSAPLVGGFSYWNIPTLTGINPTFGPTAGGTSVTLTGTNFAPNSTVTFNGLNATILTAPVAPWDSMVVQAPNGAPGIAPVIVTNPVGTSVLTPQNFTYLVAPTITSISNAPFGVASGSTAGGTLVTINGANFLAGQTSIHFGALTIPVGNVTVIGGTQATFTLPAGSGIVNVSVETPGGTTATLPFTYYADPTVSLISPSTGPSGGGTFVTITGTNLVPGSTNVLFGLTLGTGVIVNGAGTSLTVLTPSGGAGAVAVTVNTPGGSFPTAGGFTYFDLPDAVSINPTAGATIGGTPFTITGTNLAGATSVTFGGAAATGLTSNATTITGTTTAHGAATVDVVVTTPGGQDTLVGAYSYVLAPTVTAVTLNAGVTTGGNTVTVTGTGFIGATSVTFGGVAGTFLSVTNATTLTVVVPAGTAPGPVNVTVTVAGLTGTMTNGYTYWDPPTLSNVTANAGNIAGGNTVTLTGTNFAAGISVSFSGTAAGVTVTNSTTLSVTVPTHAAGPVNVTVTTPGGTSGAVTYTYYATPTLSAVTPNTGFDQGGQTVTLTGTNFVVGPGLTTVSFGGSPGTLVNVTTTTTLTVVTPSGTGTIGVSVTTPGGTTGAQTFTFYADPTLTLVSPTDGPIAGGTVVTLTGTNFVNGSTTVTFGGTAGTVGLVTGTTITVTAPIHVSGAADVVVTTPGGTATAVGGYTYHDPPTISNIVPGNGPTNGGTAFTITGTNFPAGKTTVTFGGVAATSVAAAGTTVAGNTPQRPAGAVVVRVTTPGGFVDTSYTYDAGPFISAITPNAGSTLGGNTVTITGSGLAGVTSVTFGGTAGTGLVAGANSLTIIAPSNAAGTVDVTVTGGGTFTLIGGYTYVTTPTITLITPANGPTAGGNAVTINGTSFLAGGTTVMFGATSATNVVVNSPTSLTATVPGGAAGPVDVTVTTVIGTSPPSPYTYYALPTLTNIAPNSGVDQGGQTVTLTGTNFAAGLGLTTVSFGAAPGSTVNVTGPTTLTVVTPAGTGVVNVTVTTPGGTTGVLTFTYFADPTITLINPANGPIAGGTVVTITGTNFIAGSTTVQFGAVAGTAVSVTGTTSLTVAAPAQGAGSVNVVVTTPGGVATANNGYTYHAAPTITNINPIQGPLVAGTTFTITGTNLPAGSTTVTFAGVAATGIAATVTQVTGTAPAGAAGAATVRVTTPGGFVDTTYTYVPAPTIASITPNRGSSAGGQSVTLVGGNFVTGATEVRIGGVLATALNIISGTTLTCTTPAHAAGLVDVAVTTFNPPGQTNTQLNFYTYVDAATSIDLSLLLTVDDAVPNVGQDVTLVATLSNGGAVAGSGVSVNVALPAGLSVLSAVPSSGTYAAGLWTVGGIGAATSSTLTITATVTSSATLLAAVEVAAAVEQDLDSIPGNGSTTEDDRATVTIDADLTITSASPLPGATSGAFYSQTLVAAGGALPYAWSLISSNPDFPFALNPVTGTISGTAPVVAGATLYTFTIGAADAGTDTASKIFTLTISPSASVTATVNAAPAPPAGTVGIPYGFTFTATDATPPYTWTSTGTLPTGLSLNVLTGTLAGTPTAANTFNFTINAFPRAGNPDSQAFSITIGPNPLTFITPPALPGGAQLSLYQQTLEIQGGIGGFTWAVTGGALPGGITLTPSGRTASLAGVPTTAGPVTFTIRVTDNNAGQAGVNVSRLFLIDIAAAGSTFTVNSATLPPATIGVAYTATLTSAGGTGPVTWALAGGALPLGLALAPATGVISGTPTESGVFGITVQGTDSTSATDTADLVIDVAAAPLITTPSPLPGAALNIGYFAQLVASGGTPPLAWSVTGGTLPGGVTLSAVSGALSGTPGAAGAFNFTVTATDARGATDVQIYDLTVVDTSAGLVVVSTLPPGVAGVPYNGSLGAANVTPPIIWSVTAGFLPPWATLNPSTGTVTGVPTAGTTTLTFQAADGAPSTASSGSFNLVIASSLSVATTSLPGADPGSPYSTTLVSSGGTGAVAWSLVSGSLPGGFTLTPAGTISGTTPSNGLYTIRVQVTDSLGATASRLLTLLVAPGASLANAGSSGKNCSLATAEPRVSTAFLASLLLLAGLALTRKGMNR